MPYKPRLVQKKWQVLTKPYVMYQGSPIIMDDLKVVSPCQGSGATSYSSVVRGDNAWTVYKETLSFQEVKAAVREILYEVGLKKEHIQVIELVNHDYIITPLT